MHRSSARSVWIRFLATSALGMTSFAITAKGGEIQVSVTNNAPAGGVYLTPVWVGFHDGSFDSYNGGLSSQPGLERIAEDGNPAVISSDFVGGYTYIDDTGVSPVSARTLSSQNGADRVDGVVGGGPIGPGQTVSQNFMIDAMSANQYLSYVSMVIPSNDYFVANGNPIAHDLATLHNAPIGTSISFNIGVPETVNDAGTEVNFANISGPGDMEDDTVAALGLLGPGYVGQSAPDTGADQGGVVQNVASAYMEAPSILGAHPALDFNDAMQYGDGIATVTITTVPEPSSVALAGVGLLGMLAFRRRCKGTRGR